MKTSKLQGAALDWAVAKCEGHNVRKQPSGFLFLMDRERQIAQWKPSDAWAQGGPIIERERIQFRSEQHTQYRAFMGQFGSEGVGPTHLIAAMRCYVASKFGDEVDIPQELQC